MMVLNVRLKSTNRPLVHPLGIEVMWDVVRSNGVCVIPGSIRMVGKMQEIEWEGARDFLLVAQQESLQEFHRYREQACGHSMEGFLETGMMVECLK